MTDLDDVKVHPAAEAWPALPGEDLRRLARDVEENGLRHPVVLDEEGRVLDGKNRLAACEMAGVEPEFETYEGEDPAAFVISANAERRHMSLPERAAATALTLARDGRRKDGRWERHSVPDAPQNTESGTTWRNRMREAGLVLDWLGEDALRAVASGDASLYEKVEEAEEEKERQERREDLPDDLEALVETGELTLKEAERRDALKEEYRERVESGELTLEEAEALQEREEREHREAIERTVSNLEAFISAWPIAVHLKTSPNRDEVLDALSDHDREQFLAIEQEIHDAGMDGGGEAFGDEISDPDDVAVF